MRHSLIPGASRLTSKRESAMDTYRLQIKIGSAEFNAEGPEKQVKEDYDKFLAAVSASQNRVLAPKNSPSGNQHNSIVDSALVERAFKVDGDALSLRLLPPDGPNRIAEAVVLLLYGFRTVQGVQDVPVTKLNAGLRVSGLKVLRLDRFMGAFGQYVMKGGSRSGGRYNLNNQGVAQAENLLSTYFT